MRTLNIKNFEAAVSVAKRVLALQPPLKTALINHKEPIHFLAALWVCLDHNISVFLCNPAWKQQEWLAVNEVVPSSIIFGPADNYQPKSSSISNDWHSDVSPKIMISTGGTQNGVRFAIHTWNTLLAAALGLTSKWFADPLDIYHCLPLFHVSGLMPIVRALVSNSIIHVPCAFDIHYKVPLFQTCTSTHRTCISLVPTQLYRFLSNPEIYSFLQSIDIIFIGGALLSNDLAQRACTAGLKIWLTYGMTETAGMVSVAPADSFDPDNLNCGQVLPHMQVVLLPTNHNLDRDSIVVSGTALFQGYMAHDKMLDINPTRSFTTNDLGQWDDQHNLRILGRRDRINIIGGEKVSLDEIEWSIWATEQVHGVRIEAESSLEWGIFLVAYVNIKPCSTLDRLVNLLKQRIVAYKLPKKWILDSSLYRLKMDL